MEKDELHRDIHTYTRGDLNARTLVVVSLFDQWMSLKDVRFQIVKMSELKLDERFETAIMTAPGREGGGGGGL